MESSMHRIAIVVAAVCLPFFAGFACSGDSTDADAGDASEAPPSPGAPLPASQPPSSPSSTPAPAEVGVVAFTPTATPPEKSARNTSVAVEAPGSDFDFSGAQAVGTIAVEGAALVDAAASDFRK